MKEENVRSIVLDAGMLARRKQTERICNFFCFPIQKVFLNKKDLLFCKFILTKKELDLFVGVE